MKRQVRKFLIILGRLFQIKPRGPFRRHLTRSEASQLAIKINGTLGMELREDDVLLTARKIRNIESKMIGRIAGDIDDHVLNFYLVKQTALCLPDDIAFAEIGVLFGGSLLVTKHALDDLGIQRRVIAIDPLDSYYGEREDPITLLPITKSNVLSNVRLANFAEKGFTLICAPSELFETVQSMRGVRLGGIYIDGDHSYEGVKRDWDNYSPLVVKGGYVLIDNYHDNYEGIDRFIDEEIIPNCVGWRVAGFMNRSIVFVRTEE